MAQMQVERRVAAPKSMVWSVVSDVADYARVAPNLSKVEILAGTGRGMRRRCYDLKGRGWNERCILWEDNRVFSFEVDTKAPDYPYPFLKLQGTWEVAEIPGEPNSSLIRMTFDSQLKYGIFGRWILDPLMKPAFVKICEELFDNWENLIQQAVQAQAS